jgi:hypothetical protein
MRTMVDEKEVSRDVVFRSIEGMRFAAEIIKIHKVHVDLRYLDDGNIEERVPIEEIERPKSGPGTSCQLTECKSNRDTLPRPLAGLVDDDYEIRNNMKPVVILHDRSSADDSILLNGAENKLAAGGGFRALRYLKK